MPRADETLMLVAGAAVALVLVTHFATRPAAGAEPMPDTPPPPEPDDWPIVPPPSTPGYAPVPGLGGGYQIQPPGIVPPEPSGGYFVEQGGRYRLIFRLRSMIGNLMGPPVIMSALRDAGIASPQVWALGGDRWQAEGVWSGPSGTLRPPEDVDVETLERLP